ncbi:MAG: ABC transporter ATP-binding protein [Burkholderiaceae bacterium]
MSKTALQVNGLVKRFGGLEATRNVALQIAPGTIHGLIGPNGAGKTTLISLLSGFLAADGGNIDFFGKPIQHLTQQARVRAGLVRSFQITSVFSSLTVLENLQVSVQRRHHRGFGFLAAAASDRQVRDEAAALAERVGLGRHLQSRGDALSHGMRRRLDVGLSLACAPRMLLMDEPMAGMGHDEADEVVALIRSLTPELTILLVEHDMDAVFALADQITVLVLGAVLASGPPQQIRDDPEVRAAYLGTEATP